jgi:DnaJ-domain-containing protein 1
MICTANAKQICPGRGCHTATPSANKDEIVRNYRRKIQQCHPDRVAGLSPEFLPLAEEITKTLNVAYEQAIRACR